MKFGNVIFLALAPLAASLSAADTVSFDKQIRPILARNCAGCHQPASRQSELSLATFADFQAGGRKGPAYLATFRTLGALGLMLGTVGLAAVLLRNVLERRRELALLRAVGYRPVHMMRIVLAENALLLVAGLAIGAICALVAIAPAVAARGGQLPAMSLAVLLGAVLATGFAASLAATRVALRSPLLAALRSE